jgi:hypothetical protein
MAVLGKGAYPSLTAADIDAAKRHGKDGMAA